MNRRFSRRTFFCAIAVGFGLLFFSGGSAGQQPEMITEIEGITEYRLDNGAQLLLFPDDSKPRFTVNMTVRVGSRHEGYGETGMAHLLEHMLFKGTDQHRDIPKLLKDRGVLNMNGTTWFDRTNYYETLKASDDNLEFAIRMEADRLVNSLIKAEDLASEMTVVRNEFEMGENSPQRILFQRIMASAYEWHNYGKSTIGNRSDIERVPVANLREFYRKFYQPDNIMVVIAGKFDRDRALELVQKYFGSIERPERELPKTYTEEPAQDGERHVWLRRVGDVQVVGVGYHIPAAADPLYPAAQVLSTILGMEPSGPLYKSLVETKIASRISTMEIPGHDPGMLLAFAEVSLDGDLEKARDVLIGQLESIANNGIGQDAVARAVRRLEKQREQQFANTEQFAINLSEWWAYGDWRLYFLHRDRMEKVSSSEVQSVAKQYLIQSNRTVGMFVPTQSPIRAPIPSQPSIKTMLADYKGRAELAAGEAFEPTPENINGRTQSGRLDSGIKYALLPKKTRGQRVFMRARLHYGDENSLKGKVTAAELMPELMTRGTQELGFQEFRDKLDELKANLQMFGSVGSLSVSIQTKREHFVEVLELLRGALRQPAFDPKEMDIVRRQMITQMENMRSNPMGLAAIEIQRRISPYEQGDVRYIPTINESIDLLKEVSVDDIRNLYADFVNGQHGEIAIVGDFDVQQAKVKLNSIFDNWRSSQRFSRIKQPAFRNLKGQRITLNTPDKANAVYIAGLSPAMRDDHPQYEALLIGNYILGGGPLSSRLADRVRKQEGLSYGVGSMLRADTQDERTIFMIRAISNPANTPKVVDTVDEEVKRLLESGVTGDELEKAKQSYLETRRGNRADDRRLASTLLANLEAERDMSFHKAGDERISLLNKELVDRAMKDHIDPSKLIIVTAGDFEAGNVNSGDSETADQNSGSNK